MSTFTMADTIADSLGSLPSGLHAYASYVDGFGGYSELVRLKGGTGAELLSITVRGNRARCADFESGAMSNVQAAGWLDHIAEPHPVLYTFASNAQDLINAAGPRSYKKWFAHTGQGEHLCGPRGHGYSANPGCQFPAADATQWIFNPGGANIDLSTCLPDFLAPPPPPPPPPDPHGYNQFENDLWDSRFGKIRERDVVLHYDGARQHPLIFKAYLDRTLRPRLHWLADRVFAVAHSQPNPDGSASWGLFHRGWRYQQLRQRADGKRFA